jgi:hypothetical protein
MRYRLWKMSQCTNTTPNVVPAWMPHQNHPGRLTRAISTTPTVSRAVKPATPRMGLGNPNAAAWSVFMTDPQESTGLMLHEGT